MQKKKERESVDIEKNNKSFSKSHSYSHKKMDGYGQLVDKTQLNEELANSEKELRKYFRIQLTQIKRYQNMR